MQRTAGMRLGRRQRLRPAVADPERSAFLDAPQKPSRKHDCCLLQGWRVASLPESICLLLRRTQNAVPSVLPLASANAEPCAPPNRHLRLSFAVAFLLSYVSCWRSVIFVVRRIHHHSQPSGRCSFGGTRIADSLVSGFIANRPPFHRRPHLMHCPDMTEKDMPSHMWRVLWYRRCVTEHQIHRTKRCTEPPFALGDLTWGFSFICPFWAAIGELGRSAYWHRAFLGLGLLP